MREQRGFALITALIMVVVVAALVMAHYFTTSVDLATTKANVDSTTGFYSAEAGLNLRGEAIRQRFLGYSRPSGTSPDGDPSCSTGSLGAGDFRCIDYDINGRIVTTFVVEDPGNAAGGSAIVIPEGEMFSGLNATQFRYSAFSEARPPNDDRPEARLEMVFRSRLVSMFQFAAFYDKDLEILPGPSMTLNGRVHANGDLYLNAENTLSINGQVTVADRRNGTGGDLYRRRKNNNACAGTVRVDDNDASTNPNPAVACGNPLEQDPYLDGWNGRILTNVDTLTVPAPEEFDPGAFYWQQADVRIVLNVTGGVPRIEVRNVDQTLDVGASARLNDLADTTCAAIDTAPPYATAAAAGSRLPHPSPGARAVEWSPGTFLNNREGTGDAARIWMLEVDVRALLDCLTQNRELLLGFGPGGTPLDIDDDRGGGQVWYFTVLGPASGAVSNNYGVRLRNGARLAATVAGAPAILGLTVVSDQAMYVQGDFNLNGAGNADWRPASFLADSINILSNAWDTGGTAKDATSRQTNLNDRVAASTTVNAAILAGTDTTGGTEGVAGQGGAYNGGLENYPRLHENWGGRTLTYRGSLVSLNRPRHVNGAWQIGGRFYAAPGREWDYDARFNNVNNLPPLAPQFVYLRQELFVRDFDRP
ncbi:MAG: hypothetical protein H0U69_09625 [Trueperaceae bacterium]|nr:hypothetical protein [Trueperaceae bacterium]